LRSRRRWRDGDERLASMTLLAAQVDFTEPGDLSLFIDDSQVAFLEAVMWQQGYLDTRQMAGAFQLLRSNDPICSRRLRHYLLDIPDKDNELASWNADAARMPYRMHSEYLRRLFLKNSLASARYIVDGHPVALTDIHIPIFVVGTMTDHVAPWRSVYKIVPLSDTEVTFHDLRRAQRRRGVAAGHAGAQLPDRYPRAGHALCGAGYLDGGERTA
jgi:polyhydroxyalkanoate synthase